MPRADSGATVIAGRETAHRFAQRVRAERRRRRRRWLAGGVVLALLVAAVVVVARSPLLRVERVVVTGTRRQPVGEVLASARIARRSPMWTLDVAAVRRRVSSLPRVKAAAVSRSWPRTVRILVTERQPVAAVAVPAGGHVIVDSAAAEIEKQTLAPAGLLAVRLTARSLPDTAAARAPLVTAALAVAVSLPAPVRARVGAIRVASAEDVEIGLTDGTLIRWGSADLAARKAQVLLALLRTPQSMYDVRAPDSPAVR